LELGSGIGFLGIIVGALQQQQTRRGPSSSLWLTDINDQVLDRCRQNLKLKCSRLKSQWHISLTLTIPPLLDVTSSHPSINFLKLDWFSSVNAELESRDYQSFLSLIHDKVKPDIIIGADIVSYDVKGSLSIIYIISCQVFNPTLIPCLVETINLCLREYAKFALIAATVRNESTFSHFLMHLHGGTCSSLASVHVDTSFPESSLHVEEVSFTSVWPFHQNSETPGVDGIKLFRIARFEINSA